MVRLWTNKIINSFFVYEKYFAVNILSIIMWFLVDFFLYLIVDNITKFFIINNRWEFDLFTKKKSAYLFRRENRFDILISECLLLGFLIGFISFYHHITYVLIVLLFIHIIGTIYTERRFDLIRNGLKIFIEFFRLIFNRLFKRSSTNSKIVITRKLPEKYLYTYHLKPTNDLQLQQVNHSKISFF